MVNYRSFFVIDNQLKKLITTTLNLLKFWKYKIEK
jgi:hypothetical protein